MKTDVEKNVKKEKLKKLTAKALMTFYRKQTILSIRVRGSIIYVRTSIEDEKGKKTMRTVILLYDECCDKRYNSFWHTLTADYIDTANVVKAHFILLVNKSIDRCQLLELSDKEYPYQFDERGFPLFYKPGYIKSYDELGEEYRTYSMYKENEVRL